MKITRSLHLLFALALIIGCGKSEKEINGELESINSSLSAKLEKASGKGVKNGVIVAQVYTPGECETGGETIAQDILSDASAPSWAKGLSNYGVISFCSLQMMGDLRAGENNDHTSTLNISENRLFFGYEGDSWKYIGTELRKQMTASASGSKALTKPETSFKYDYDYSGGPQAESAIAEAAQQ